MMRTVLGLPAIRQKTVAFSSAHAVALLLLCLVGLANNCSHLGRVLRGVSMTFQMENLQKSGSKSLYEDYNISMLHDQVQHNIDKDEVISTIDLRKNVLAVLATPDMTGTNMTKANKNHGGSSPCRNKDFEPKHSKAVVTFLTGYHPDYISGVRALTRSIRQHLNADVDIVLMQQGSNDGANGSDWNDLLSTEERSELTKQTGVSTICLVDPIVATKAPHPRYRDQFAKLHIFGLTMYDRIVYLDADTLVLGGIDDLFTVDYGKLGATQRFGVSKSGGGGRRFLSTFNMGAAVVRPDAVEYQRLLRLQEKGTIVYETKMAEQGFLNVVYRDDWKEFGFKYNVNMGCVIHKGCSASQDFADARILHFTYTKPWKVCNRDRVKSADESNLFLERACESWNNLADDKPNGNKDNTSNTSICTNDDFQPTATASVWTMITPVEPNFLSSAMVLADSIKRHTTVEHDRVVIESVDNPLGDENWNELKRAGWTHLCKVNPIDPPSHGSFRRHADTFTKLRVFGATEYKHVAYLDSNTFVIGNIDAMLTGELLKDDTGAEKRIGASRGFYSHESVEGFHAGVFVIQPEKQEFERLMQLRLEERTLSVKGGPTVEGWLRKAYENSWHEIGLAYNCNMGVYARNRKTRKKHANETRVLHYNGRTIWNCTLVPCRAWNDAAKRLGQRASG